MARLLQGEDVFLSETPFVQDMVRACREWGHKVYMDDFGTKKTLTFLEFLENAGSLSSTFRMLKQTSGKKIAILSDTCIESITIVFGTWLSGAASAPINPCLPEDEIIFFLETLRCELIFCGQNYLSKVKKVASTLAWAVNIICPHGGQDGVLDFFSCLRYGDSQAALEQDGFWTGQEHVLSILFTSGTTGKPKGVPIDDRMTKFKIITKPPWDDESRVFITTPMYWSSTNSTLAVSCITGSVLLIASKMPTMELMQVITDSKPTDWITRPAIILEMSQNEDLSSYDFSSFRALTMVGSILLPEQRRVIVNRLFQGRDVTKSLYGSTEVGTIATNDRLIDKLDSPKMASVGQVVKGVTVKIMDVDSHNILPPYSVGEVCIKSLGVCNGYINKSTTEEMDKDGFWHMGDLGYYDDDGYIYITSRLTDVIKYKNYQIAPAELEAVIQRHPDVLESCVLGKSCLEMGGDLPTAFVVKRPDSALTEQDLYNFISDNVIDEKKLRGGIFFLDSLPKSAVGKVLRHALQKKLTT